MYDLIIIGAGPAGITAAIYAARKKMDFLVVSKDIGGQTAVSGEIENYTGYQFITGPELTQKFEEHMRQFGIPLKENEGVTGIKKINNNSFQVVTDKANYEAKTVIIASGKRSRELNVPGEKEFKNKGLTYCATCDAPLFSAKIVAVIGAGNSGLDATLQLMKIAKFIYLINIAPSLTGDPIMEEKVLESKMVKVLNSTQVTAVLGDKMLNTIKIKRESKEETLPVEGVFVEIGLIPNSELAKEVKKINSAKSSLIFPTKPISPGFLPQGMSPMSPRSKSLSQPGRAPRPASLPFAI